MSLINKMLQDLEARQETAGAGGTASIYQGLRPVPLQRRRGAGIWFGVAAVALVVAGYIAAERFGVSIAVGGSNSTIAAPGAVAAPSPAKPAPQPIQVVAAEPRAASVTPPAPPSDPKASNVANADAADATAVGAVTEPAPARPAATNAPPHSRERAEVGIVKAKTKAIPASAHKGERDPAADHAAPANPAPVQTAERNISVDIRARPLTDEQSAEATFREALRQLELGRMEAATRKLHDALAEYPKHVKARELAAALALQGGHWREAQALLEEGLRQVPNQYLFARLLARVYVDHGAEAKALAVLESAAPSGSDDADFSALLGLLYQRAGRHAEAVQAYERALALDSRDPRAWLGYAISLEALGRAQAAKSAYERAHQGSLPANLARYAEQRLAALENR